MYYTLSYRRALRVGCSLLASFIADPTRCVRDNTQVGQMAQPGSLFPPSVNFQKDGDELFTAVSHVLVLTVSPVLKSSTHKKPSPLTYLAFRRRPSGRVLITVLQRGFCSQAFPLINLNVGTTSAGSQICACSRRRRSTQTALLYTHSTLLTR